MTKRGLVLVALAVLPWVGLNAQQDVSTTFRVSARVNSVCDITAANLAFGNYNSNASNPLQATTLLRATCTPSTSYQIGLNEGTTPGGTVNQRKMASASGQLNYQLYSDSARTVIWGNTPGTDTVTGVGTGLAVEHTVYGAVPTGQTVPGEEFSDTITVRLYY